MSFSLDHTDTKKVVKCLSCVAYIHCVAWLIYFSLEIQGTWEIGANRRDWRRKSGEKCGAEYGGNISEKSWGHTSKYNYEEENIKCSACVFRFPF